MSEPLFKSIYTPEMHRLDDSLMEISLEANCQAKALFDKFPDYDPTAIAGLVGSIFWTEACRRIIDRRQEVHGDPVAKWREEYKEKVAKWRKECEEKADAERASRNELEQVEAIAIIEGQGQTCT